MSKINRRPVRRTAAGVLASTLMLSGVVAAATPAHAAPGFALDRLQGNDRYETSAAIAAAFGTATNVILASGESGRTPDALAASFLAGVQNAPVLVTRRDTTPEPILAALRTLRAGGATTLTVVGGPVAVSEAQLTALRALGFTSVTRVAGADRFQTAAAIAAAGEGATASNIGLVASGVSTIDALAGGPLAFKGRHPLFLVTRTGIPAASLAAMRANGITSVYILGGEAVVGPQVAAQLTAAGITVTGRLAGANRSETSVAIANALVTNFAFTNTTFNLASGTNEGIDALGGAALSGKQNRPLLITNNATSATPVVGYATARAATLNAVGIIFGGPTVVAPALETQIETAGGGTGGGTAGIALTAQTAVQGSTFTGTLANPGTVQNVSVTGCGFNNQSVTISSAGGFSLALPAGQSVGACPLAFTVLRTDGTTVTQTVQFTVTAAQSSTTAAPDLVSAAVNATSGVVTYTFDQDVTGLAIGTSAARLEQFYIYDAAGARNTASEASVSGSTVIARFGAGSTGTDRATAATLAGVDNGAVQDAAGRQSYAASVPLGAQTQTSGRTAGPDLESVSNIRIEGGAIVADFRFDEAIERSGTANPPTLTGSNAGNFRLVASDGTVYGTGGNTFTSASADNRTVTVAFAGTPTTIPLGSIVRGVALTGAVDGADTDPVNVQQTEPRTGTPAFTTGVLADRTDDPDLVSATVAGTDVIQFTFDEPVNVGTTAAFNVYTGAGVTPIPATGTAVRSSTDTRIVNVTFGTGVVSTAVGVTLNSGAVTAVDDAAPNAVHETGLQNVSNTAGRTGSPDLVSARITVNEFGNNTVVFTFDQAITAAQAAAGVFGLVDANGVRFPVTGPGTLGSSNTTLSFTGATGFSNAQAAAAVVANFEDPSDAAADPTTGDVPVQRS